MLALRSGIPSDQPPQEGRVDAESTHQVHHPAKVGWHVFPSSGLSRAAGLATWGPQIEATRWISAVVTAAGLAGAKLVAIGFGTLLHLHRVHLLVALLTAFYVFVAILPWTALFLMR